MVHPRACVSLKKVAHSGSLSVQAYLPPLQRGLPRLSELDPRLSCPLHWLLLPHCPVVLCCRLLSSLLLVISSAATEGS